MLTAAAVGAGLALAGAVMQSLTRNPLADPYLLGLSSGASLGAVAVLVVGVSLLLPVAAFAGALLALVATLALARSGSTLLARTHRPGRPRRVPDGRGGRPSSSSSGAPPATPTGRSSTGCSARWRAATWASVAIAGVAVLASARSCVLSATRLDAFAFGDTSAAALGIDVDRTRWTLMTVVALLTGAMVAVSGAIGFVGLILPHAVSSLTGPAHRRLLPVAALSGAVFLIWADTLARTVFDPRELPVGIVTALIGVPVFAFLLRRGKGSAWT